MNRWTRADQVPQVKMKVKLKVQVKVKDDLVNKDWPGRHKCKQGCQTCRSKIETKLLSSSNSIDTDMTAVKILISSLSIFWIVVREQKGSKSPGSSLRSIRTTFTIAINALCLQLFSPEQNRNINRAMYNCTYIGRAIMSKNKIIIANLHRLHWRGSTAQ